ncbi:GroEL-like apical domain [Pseudocohnilembus persalinus]|uniref:GroEL-like apical domain n=1 Tax=Pseudocohnilembus persalinus TaxID=266149 RepID=A0A0V0R0B4_PSEPJ|nr:GroEL-like apical domain [Pseudocohnilembus persalinus]|eukprot:KRX07999.1 GroEL-like apical domain [Pseudocohnilembus persalinus]
MSSVQYINSKAEVLKKVQALAMNINAAVGLMDIMKSNLGPKGTLKMLVGGAGQIKLTKDGNILLHEMQIQHPTAIMIARSATAQDDIVGDGTTSNVLFIGEMMKLAQRLYQDGIHPRIIVDGYETAKQETLRFLEEFKVNAENPDKALLLSVARTALQTKLHPELSKLLVDIVVDAVQIVRQPEKAIDLHMVEIMHMVHKLGTTTRLIKGLVLDHGARHANMPEKLKNVYILTANVSLEYEKTEVHSGFFYSTADQREKLQQSERRFTDERCRKIIELKKKVCDGTNKTFCLINQKGIDPVCLDMLAQEGIIALRRAKRRNMERIVLACGGNAINDVEELTESDLGWCEEVYEQSLGDDKYTFLEGVKDPKSCTILINGPNEHTIAQIKDAVRDGLRVVKNVYEDKCVVPGAGSFEIAASVHLQKFAEDIKGKTKLAVLEFANALLVIPKVLAENSGYDIQETILELQDEYRKSKVAVGINVIEQGVISPSTQGIWDIYLAKKQWLHIAPTLVQQLLLVDEVMRAGKGMK